MHRELATLKRFARNGSLRLWRVGDLRVFNPGRDHCHQRHFYALGSYRRIARQFRCCGIPRPALALRLPLGACRERGRE